MLTIRLNLRRFAFAALTAAAPTLLSAQAITTASKSAEITGFGGYTYNTPDYGPDYIHDNGLTVGANYIFYIGHLPVAPAIEVRYTNVTGELVDLHAFYGGAEIRTAFFNHKLRPYADVLIGSGTLKFHYPPSPGYFQDTATPISYGVGLDYHLVGPVYVKADYQYQKWTFDNNFKLNPTFSTIGVAYKIPFHPGVGSREHRFREDRNPPKPAPAGPPAPVVIANPATDQTPTAPADQAVPANPAAPATTPAPGDQTAPATAAPADAKPSPYIQPGALDAPAPAPTTPTDSTTGTSNPPSAAPTTNP